MMRGTMLTLGCLIGLAAGWLASAEEPMPAVAPLPEPYASADARRGRILFLQCVACHDLGPSAIVKVGPNLQGLPGRKAGSAEGFTYSEAMRASGIVWTPEALDRFIEQPAAVVPGTIMVLAGVAKPADRAAITRFVFEQTAVE